jgi:hypothetical protein
MLPVFRYQVVPTKRHVFRYQDIQRTRSVIICAQRCMQRQYIRLRSWRLLFPRYTSNAPEHICAPMTVFYGSDS